LLAADWNFDEGQGTVATDSSGSAHTCQLVGTAWVPQGSGQALSFDGRDDYVLRNPSESVGR